VGEILSRRFSAVDLAEFPFRCDRNECPLWLDLAFRTVPVLYRLAFGCFPPLGKYCVRVADFLQVRGDVKQWLSVEEGYIAVA